MQSMSSVERAFQLARDGEHHSLDDVRRALDREGYNQNLISGPVLLAQLRKLMLASGARLEKQPSAPVT
jgi:hypothetical protein